MSMMFWPGWIFIGPKRYFRTCAPGGGAGSRTGMSVAAAAKAVACASARCSVWMRLACAGADAATPSRQQEKNSSVRLTTVVKIPVVPTTRLTIAYDGTPFAGWARQPGERTVQGELERALGVILRGPVTLTVAGRTDAGVHAWAQVASYRGVPPD